jgi:hypothetical protein
MATRMQQRRGTAAQWTAADPVLAAGEMGFETDTNEFRIGDGVNVWSDLSPFKNLEDLGGSLDDYVLIASKGQANGVASLNAQGQVPVSQLGLVIDGAPAALDTLNEIAAALADDSSYATTIINALESKAGLTYVNLHKDATTSVHGIANTALLATTANVETAKSEAIADAGTAADTKVSNAVAALTKSSVGLNNVDNTTDAQKPVSTEQAAAIATAKSEAIASGASDLSTHNLDTTSVHGISDTANLVYTSTVTAHTDATTGVHGITDTAALATKTYADTAVSTHNSDTTDVHGIADTAALATKTYADAAEADAITAAGTAADTKIATAVAALTKSSVGLGNVDNTADASKPVSTAQATAIATAKSEAIADATSQVSALIAGAPAAMNTLDELAAALGDDANYAATITTSLGLKVDSLTPISQKSASYTLSSLTERDDLIEMGSASAMTLTIPADSTLNFPVGTSIDILQTSTGQVTVAGAGGVTVNATPGLKLRTTWSSATLMKRAANTWVVIGDLSA